MIHNTVLAYSLVALLLSAPSVLGCSGIARRSDYTETVTASPVWVTPTDCAPVLSLQDIATSTSTFSDNSTAAYSTLAVSNSFASDVPSATLSTLTIEASSTPTSSTSAGPSDATSSDPTSTLAEASVPAPSPNEAVIPSSNATIPTDTSPTSTSNSTVANSTLPVNSTAPINSTTTANASLSASQILSGLANTTTEWSLVSTFTSFPAFYAAMNFKNWAFYPLNTAIVQGIPASAWNNVSASSGENNGSALSIAYPAGSVSPGSQVNGGAGFYSTPIVVREAQNLTMEYSVFFPAGFNFVKGGVLPGLFGGLAGCAHGSTAENCFSTRLMWRTGGIGEMYLYAPRSAQVTSTCTAAPLSFCNTVRGMSIGRGSWTFATGVWTTVRQDVWLNTPGVADGGFNVWINGALVLSASEVYYRHASSTLLSDITSPNTTFNLVDYDVLPVTLVIPNGGFLSQPISSATTLLKRSQGTISKRAPLEIAGRSSTRSKAKERIAGRSSTNSREKERISGRSSTHSREKERIAARSSTHSHEKERIAERSSTLSPEEERIAGRSSTNSGHKERIAERSSMTSQDERRSLNRFADVNFRGMMIQSYFGGSTNDFATPTAQVSYFNSFALTINS